MKHNTNYAINHLENTIIVTKNFLKEAGMIGTTAYAELIALRKELPDYQIVPREIKKPHRTKPGSHLTYIKMKNHIAAKEGTDSEAMKAFEKVKELAKAQVNPFDYTKKWFLEHYSDDFKDTEDVADADITSIAKSNVMKLFL